MLKHQHAVQTLGFIEQPEAVWYMSAFLLEPGPPVCFPKLALSALRFGAYPANIAIGSLVNHLKGIGFYIAEHKCIGIRQVH